MAVYVGSVAAQGTRDAGGDPGTPYAIRCQTVGPCGTLALRGGTAAKRAGGFVAPLTHCGPPRGEFPRRIGQVTYSGRFRLTDLAGRLGRGPGPPTKPAVSLPGPR